MEQLIVAPSSVLLLDYDGTLAPFQTERHRAYPYPRVIPFLQSILQCKKSKVVIITGRPVVQIEPLVSPLHEVEIWGCHGLEHRLADGTYRQTTIASDTAALLSRAELWLTAAGLASNMEVKTGGIAVHWRGKPDAEVESIRTCAQNGLSAFLESSELELLEFEGGLELRVAHPNKGDAIVSILHGLGQQTQVAYLGDDQTDEDAFRVLNPRGLSVLVRNEYRETYARIWLRPPEELISFLERWINSVSAQSDNPLKTTD